jgi:hypothetical protein
MKSGCGKRPGGAGELCPGPDLIFRDLLRLHFGLHLPQRQIARSVKLSQSTIHDYIGRFEKWGLPGPYRLTSTRPDSNKLCPVRGN